MSVIVKYVAYYRVSTKRQGRSGLGLEAQQNAVHAIARKNGATIIAEYVEVETGKSAKRPKLHEAIRHAKLTNSTLVVAKLDRLARNVYFTFTLRDSGQRFLCCDNEHANELTIGLLALIAQHEAEQIAARTKAALAVAKDRGTALGSARPGHWDGREDRRQAGAANGLPLAVAEHVRVVREHYGDTIVPKIKAWREEGRSLDEIAALLNADNFTTRPTKRCKEGCAFTKSVVWRLIDRYLGREYLGSNPLAFAGCN